MVLDANGRSHRPKGLPRGLAGTYDANAAAVRDTDLTPGGAPRSAGMDAIRRAAGPGARYLTVDDPWGGGTMLAGYAREDCDPSRIGPLPDGACMLTLQWSGEWDEPMRILHEDTPFDRFAILVADHDPGRDLEIDPDDWGFTDDPDTPAARIADPDTPRRERIAMAVGECDRDTVHAAMAGPDPVVARLAEISHPELAGPDPGDLVRPPTLGSGYMGGGEYRGARYDPGEPPDRVAAGMRGTLKALRERGVIDPAYRTSVARRDGRFRVTLTVPAGERSYEPDPDVCRFAPMGTPERRLWTETLARLGGRADDRRMREALRGAACDRPAVRRARMWAERACRQWTFDESNPMADYTHERNPVTVEIREA